MDLEKLNGEEEAEIEEYVVQAGSERFQGSEESEEYQIPDDVKQYAQCEGVVYNAGNLEVFEDSSYEEDHPDDQHFLEQPPESLPLSPRMQILTSEDMCNMEAD